VSCAILFYKEKKNNEVRKWRENIFIMTNHRDRKSSSGRRWERRKKGGGGGRREQNGRVEEGDRHLQLCCKIASPCLHYTGAPKGQQCEDVGEVTRQNPVSSHVKRFLF
jgi:hypothetical protein